MDEGEKGEPQFIIDSPLLFGYQYCYLFYLISSI